ncbi:hypothetical protein V6N13_092361 [Hibiscus sabdariffa]
MIPSVPTPPSIAYLVSDSAGDSTRILRLLFISGNQIILYPRRLTCKEILVFKVLIKKSRICFDERFQKHVLFSSEISKAILTWDGVSPRSYGVDFTRIAFCGVISSLSMLQTSWELIFAGFALCKE